MSDQRFGNRRVPKMYAQVNELRQAIATEGSPRIQAAWDKVEEHIDFAYQQVAATPSREQIETWNEAMDLCAKLARGNGAIATATVIRAHRKPVE